MKASIMPSIIASSSSHPAKVNKTTLAQRSALVSKTRKRKKKRERNLHRLTLNKIRKVRSCINREILRYTINKAKSQET